MALYIGIDTSNYTTSVAVYNTDERDALHKKRLLPVKPGERGIRQSDAVFHHTNQIADLVDDLTDLVKNEWGIPDLSDVRAIGASVRPRSVDGSYMPCFTVGRTTARILASVLGVPCYEFSHQDGHVAAALYSAGKLEMLRRSFLAFHVSGGTTESLLVSPSAKNIINVDLIGTSTDLKAGQAIDRVGLMLGLFFPCGPELEIMAKNSKKEFKIKPPVKGFDCSLSGVENKCKKMLDEGEPHEDIALYCIKYIEAALMSMASSLTDVHPGLHILFSGGVMSNSIIRESFEKCFDCSFASPEFSSDNAVGISVLTALKGEMGEA